MAHRDFAIEGSKKSSLQKGFNWMGNQLGYDLIDNDSQSETYLHLKPGVAAVVFKPQGASDAGIPKDGGWILTGPFVHERGTYDQDGNELTPPNLSNDWVINMRLYDHPGDPSWNPYTLDTVSSPVDSFHESVIRSALDTLGASLSRPSENGSDVNPVSYWQFDLQDGDFLRLYWGDNALGWKNIWAGGNTEVTG